MTGDHRMSEAAMAYAAQGIPVFALAGKVPFEDSHGYLDATTDPDAITAIWRDHPDANIGVACERADWVVIDVDRHSGGIETWERIRSEIGREVLVTRAVRTGRGGFHLIYRAPDGIAVQSSAGMLGQGIDVKAAGGYVVAPPSVHPETGRRYTWIEKTAHLPLTPLPDALLARLLEARNDRDCAPALPTVLAEGQRNEQLMSLAGSMRRRDASVRAIIAALKVENEDRCVPPLSDDEVEKIARSAGRYPPSARARSPLRIREVQP